MEIAHQWLVELGRDLADPGATMSCYEAVCRTVQMTGSKLSASSAQRCMCDSESGCSRMALNASMLAHLRVVDDAAAVVTSVDVG